jgi:hypothetical protein
MKNNSIPKSMHHIRGSALLLWQRVFVALFVVDTVYAGLLLGTKASFLIVVGIVVMLWFVATLRHILSRVSMPRFFHT